MRDYIVLDLEMTGLNPAKDHVLEIGAIRVRDKKSEAVFDKLVISKIRIPEKITGITGITNEMSEQGEPMDSVMNELLIFIEDLPLVGHNIMFDYSFIRQWTLNHKIHMEKYGLDTLKLARTLRPELEKKTLEALCTEYKIEREREHRALDDAKATQRLYEIMEQEFEPDRKELFVPHLLMCSLKRQTPATARQIAYLKKQIEQYKIVRGIDFSNLSRSEASRISDQIISQYGKLTDKE